MVGMIDIAPVVEKVDIRGTVCAVRGLELDQIVALCWEFPEIEQMWEKRKVDNQALLKLSRPAMGAIIAACVDEIDAKNATNLSLGERVEVLAKIVKVTMPRGLGPFVELLGALRLGDYVQPPPAPASKSPKPPKS